MLVDLSSGAFDESFKFHPQLLYSWQRRRFTVVIEVLCSTSLSYSNKWSKSYTQQPVSKMIRNDIFDTSAIYSGSVRILFITKNVAVERLFKYMKYLTILIRHGFVCFNLNEFFLLSHLLR